MKTATATKAKTTQKGSEGILNKVNNNYNTSIIKKTISVIKLITEHKPKSQQELLNLIETHHKDNTPCKCGCIANGNIDDWAQNLYEAYLKHEAKELKKGNTIPYKNLEDCKIFMNYLFVKGSLKGGEMETVALKSVNKIPLMKELGFKCVKGSEEDDFKYSVDLLVTDKNNNTLMGIQVKPESYKGAWKHGKSIHENNISNNKAFGKPVIYIYYNKKGDFIQNDDTSKEFNRILLEAKSNSIPKVTF